MRDSSYYSSRVDWTAVRAAAHAQAAGATTYVATYPAISTALAALGDRHSALQPPSASGASADRASVTAHPADSLDGEMLGGRFGYVRIPTFAPAPYTLQVATAFADTIQGLVRAVDASAPCGWVVDLRHNFGGRFWPMLTGIGPILGAGSSLGSFLDPKGSILTWWYNAGASGLSDSFGSGEALKVSGAPYVLRAQNPPVAVLTDSLTAGGGEGQVVAFHGRSSTRSFGAATYGVPTATISIRLADGAALVLTRFLYRDRNGRPYDAPIAPDEPVAQSGAPATDDATVAAATAWLATQPACAGQ